MQPIFEPVLNDEQRMLRDAVEGFVTANRDAPDLWPRMAGEMGLMALGLPEVRGGLGGPVEVALVQFALGKANARIGWIDTMAVANLLSDQVVGEIIAGGARIAVAQQGSDIVPFANDATHILAGDKLYTASEISVSAQELIDGSMAGRVETGSASGVPISGDLEAARDTMIVGRAAELCGLIDTMLRDTITFMGERRQFGQSIGAFQVLRHRMTDLYMEALKAGALTEKAILALDGPAQPRAKAVSAAKVQTALAAKLVGEGAVQIHGAMGLTEELRLGGYFKSALVLAGLDGGMTHHLERHRMALAA